MNNACDWLVAATYVVAAAVLAFAVTVRMRSTMEDVERHCTRSVLAWYAFRSAAVVVVLGGLLHGRMIAFRALQAVAAKLL